MIRFFIFVLALITLCTAQINYKTTETNVTTFRADSTYYSPWVSLTDGENIDFTVLINDTSSEGYASDSIAARLGYQYGATYLNYLGVPVTVARGPVHFYDSIRTTSGRYVTSTWLGAGIDSFPETMLDTNGSLGYAFNVRYMQLYVNPLIRQVVAGLTGNEKGSFLRLRTVIGQRKWGLAGKN